MSSMGRILSVLAVIARKMLRDLLRHHFVGVVSLVPRLGLHLVVSLATAFKETGSCQINIIWYLFTLGPGDILG